MKLPTILLLCLMSLPVTGQDTLSLTKTVVDSSYSFLGSEASYTYDTTKCVFWGIDQYGNMKSMRGYYYVKRYTAGGLQLMRSVYPDGCLGEDKKPLQVRIAFDVIDFNWKDK